MMMSTYGDYSMSILKNVVKPDQLVDKQGAKILVYGESAGKT